MSCSARVDCEPRWKQRGEPCELDLLASLRVKCFSALGNRNWLWAEGLLMRFRLHKRNHVFMLLLERRFLKVESGYESQTQHSGLQRLGRTAFCKAGNYALTT